MVEQGFRAIAFLLTVISSYLTATWLGAIPGGVVDQVVMGVVGVIFTVCMVLFPGVGMRIGGVLGYSMVLAGVCMLLLSVFASYERLDKGHFNQVDLLADADGYVADLKSQADFLKREIEFTTLAIKKDIDNGFRKRALETKAQVGSLRAELASLNEKIRVARERSGESGTIPEGLRIYVYLVVSVLIDLCAQFCFLFLMLQDKAEPIEVIEADQEKHPLEVKGVLSNGRINPQFLYQGKISQNRLEKVFNRSKAKAIIDDLIASGLVDSDKKVTPM